MPRNRDAVFWLMKRAFSQQHRAIDDAMRANGVSAAQAGVLDELLEQPGLSAADVARRLDISAQAATVAISNLERRGLVERSSGRHHGRILHCDLTDEGRRVVSACQADAHKVSDRLLGVLDPEQQQTLAHLLKMLLGEARGEPRNGAPGNGRSRHVASTRKSR